MSWFDDVFSFFSTVLTVVAALVVPELLAIAKLISYALEKLGVIDHNENPEDIGEKYLQAGESGIRVEDFDNYDDFVKEIENFDIDPKKVNDHSVKERLDAYVTLRATQLENLVPGLGTFVTEIVPKLTKEFSIDTKFGSMLDNFRSDMSGLNGYFKGELSDEKFSSVQKHLFDIEKKIDPNKSDLDVINALKNERLSVQGKL